MADDSSEKTVTITVTTVTNIITYSGVLMIQQSKPPLTQQEHTRLLLRIAILEDMVAYLLGETDPTEAQHFTSAIRKAEKIINTSQQVVRDCIKQLTTQKEEEHGVTKWFYSILK